MRGVGQGGKGYEAEVQSSRPAAWIIHSRMDKRIPVTKTTSVMNATLRLTMSFVREWWSEKSMPLRFRPSM